MRRQRVLSGSVLALLVMMFTLVLAGCGNDAVQITMPEQVASTASGDSKQIDVDVYWDATVSMQGYTTITNGNFYRTLPDRLGDIGSNFGETKFYRFGKDIKQLEGREYRKFSEPGYYDELITAFHNVIDKADESHLSIVVTDLFESDSDWSNVTKKLKEKYFAKHLAVGIIGIKNPFDGDIFDVGLNAAKYKYNSGNDPAKYRPFYLFIMGPEEKVAEFFNTWKERQSNAVEMQYLLLSENLTEEAADFSRLEIKDSKNIFKDERLAIKDKRIREFGIDSFGDESMLVSTFNYKPRFGSFPLDMNKLLVKSEVFILEEGEWKLVDDMDGKIDATVAPDSESSGNYNITVKFTPELSTKAGYINFLHVSVCPEEKGFQMPDWIKQWNMANIDIAPDQFDGSKTIHLMHLVDSLKASVLATSHPSLVNMNMVIDYR